MTEKENMLAGRLYDSSDKELVSMRAKAHKLSAEYNSTFETQETERAQILRTLVPQMGSDTYLQGPIQFDYGVFTSFGERCYANFNLTVLDCAPVTIGRDVFFGPNCTLATPMHPLLASERNLRSREDGSLYNIEYAKPITIGDGCWIASNVTICGGVTIGAGTVIAAGSVVTRDIPAGVIAAGVPCRVIREITEADSVEHIAEIQHL
ncbi:MAG: sugar O-acetyltransferase [Oscillospiraceae bacterium]|nr:sugar O-acetyltransferase [Oscillospiraceae bacterium]